MGSRGLLRASHGIPRVPEGSSGFLGIPREVVGSRGSPRDAHDIPRDLMRIPFKELPAGIPVGFPTMNPGGLKGH